MSAALSGTRRRRHNISGFADTHLNRGRPVMLVRWVHSADGWSYLTRVGVYLGSTPESLRLEVDGVERLFDRDQWMVVAR